MWDPATTQPLIEELEDQMPRLAQSIAARDFVALGVTAALLAAVIVLNHYLGHLI